MQLEWWGTFISVREIQTLLNFLQLQVVETLKHCSCVCLYPHGETFITFNLSFFCRRLIKKLSDAIRDVDDTFEDIERELHNVMKTLDEKVTKLLTRVEFHSRVALKGVEYIIEHDFVRGWEVIEERTLGIMTLGFYEIINSMDRFIHQSNSSSILSDGSGDVSSVKDVLWLIIDADLANKLHIIQRAKRNITDVHNAYNTGKPIIQSEYSPEQRYDMSLIPMDVLHHDQKKQNHYYEQITQGIEDYVDAIENLRHLGNVFLSDGTLDRNFYEETKGKFITAAKVVNHRISQYKDWIVHKSLELVKEKISNFVSLNDTLTKTQEGLKSLVDTTTVLVHSEKLTKWKHIKEAGIKCRGYLQDFNGSKTELSEFLNSVKMQEDLIKLDNFFINLRSKFVELLDLWAKMHQSYKGVFKSIVSESMTHEFYTMLNNDTKQLIADPENNTEIFFPILGPLLKMDEKKFNNTNVTDLVILLNADVPDIDLDAKMQEIDEVFTKLMKQFDITKYIKDRDEAFLAIIKVLQNSFKLFSERNFLGFEFYRYVVNYWGYSLSQ